MKNLLLGLLVMASLTSYAVEKEQLFIEDYQVMEKGDRDLKQQKIRVDAIRSFADGSLQFINPKVTIDGKVRRLTSGSASNVCDLMEKRLGERQENKYFYAKGAILYKKASDNSPIVRESKTHWLLESVTCENY